jgi:hypothetical protein
MSLFPFMSILVCLIGSLTLMIALLMATQAGGEQSDETLERYRTFTQLQADIAFQKSELESVEALVQDANHLTEETQKALAEVAALEREQSTHLERVDSNSAYARMLAEANELRKRIASLENDPAELDREIAKVEAEVKRRNAGPEEAVVQIRPGGTGVDIVPTFVECAAGGLVVHGGAEPVRIRAADIAAEGGEFHKLLERVASTPKGEVVLLVRPDGIATYNTARSAARTFYFDSGFAKTGKLPVPTQGNIDLSVFGAPAG